MSFSDYVLPATQRVGRWSLTMAWWALFSAMFWLYIAVACANAVGVTDTIIGMLLSVIAYGAINALLGRFGAKTGLTVELLSRSLFGIIGSALATLIFAATAIYYIVFEGTMIAVAGQLQFGGDIKWWYLGVVLYALPLAVGGVVRWLDRLNGWLLPIYFFGLIAAVIVTATTQGVAVELPPVPAPGVVPGWLTVFLIYMGVWIMMMYTFDYARMGQENDQKFHSNITFGWFFYLFTFVFNGLIGIYLVLAWGVSGTETGAVEAIIKSLGVVGFIVVFVSQTRINSASYYLSSTNMNAFFNRLFGWKLPRWIYVGLTGVLVYTIMLTDVLTWILKALAWQGVFVTAWVAIAVVYVLWANKRPTELPEIRTSHLSKLAPGALVWLLSSAIGIWLTEQIAVPLLAQFAPLIVLVLAGGGYLIALAAAPPKTIPESEHLHIKSEELHV